MTQEMQKQESRISVFLTSNAVKNKINSMIGGKDGQRFISAVVSAVSVNPQLAECANDTILSAALLGESLKLSPSPQLGQYYMVPFNDKKRNCKIATFQLGYKGYIQLAIRSGYYKKLNVLAIKESELISYDPLEEEIKVRLIEDEEERESTPTVGYYAMFEYQNGFRKSLYWSQKKMETHADKYSAAFSLKNYKLLQDGKVPQNELWKYSSFWYKDFEEMAKKTMIRQIISKWGIMSIEMQQAYESDQALISDNGPEYVDTATEIEINANTIDMDIIPEQESTPPEPKKTAAGPGF